MNTKTLRILAIIAVAAALAAVLGQRMVNQSSSIGASVGGLLLPELSEALADIDRITVLGAGGEATVTVQRNESGWVVAEQGNYPADFGVVRDALTGLAEARIVEEKTSDPAFYARLGVEDPSLPAATGVAVTVAAGATELPAVILGTSDGSNERFARLADRDLSLLIDRNPEFPQEPSRWVVADILDIRSDRVQRVEIAHADGERLTISKQTRDDTSFTVEDIPEGRELQYSTIANVTGNALRNLRLEEVATRQTPAPEPVVTTEFWTFDGLAITATSRMDGENAWIDFSARYDAEQALAFASETSIDEVADEPAPSDSDTADAEAEALELNERLSSWRYRIPAHIYDQMTRRMDDLLKAPADAEESE